jgi:lipoprotein-anchoring transpeptidase ErfK/SrfK
MIGLRFLFSIVAAISVSSAAFAENPPIGVFLTATTDAESNLELAHEFPLVIVVDKAPAGATPTAQTLSVYQDGTLTRTFVISTGREQIETTKSGRQTYTSTPEGDHRILRRKIDYVSQAWEASMPFAQFFWGGIAIHATTQSHYAELGQRASGGCVRMRYEDAKFMWNLVSKVGANNVVVRVKDFSNP